MNDEKNIDIISNNIETISDDVTTDENLNIIEDVKNDNYLNNNIKISDLESDIEVVEDLSTVSTNEVPLIDENLEVEVISAEELLDENLEVEVLNNQNETKDITEEESDVNNYEIINETQNTETSTTEEVEVTNNEAEIANQEINSVNNEQVINETANKEMPVSEEIEITNTEETKNIETESVETENTKEGNFEATTNIETETPEVNDNSSSMEYCGNKESFDIISNYGENFSTKEYLTNPAIGRDNEIKQLIVTLLTPEKSGILVGKPGIGKTAIVEGLGYRIKIGDVPNALKGYTIFKLNTASLTGTMPGTNELKIQFIVDHLKNLDKIMVFIDEIHTLIGDGENTLDFANIFKPIIDRGDIKIIGATTSDEYDRYILKDKAFVRRFQKIEVSEPDREMAIQIMMGTYPKFEKKMGLKLKYTDFIKENIMAFIVDATSEFKRVYETSVRYPDISLTILQQAFSYASFDNREEVTIRDVRKAIQTTKLIYPDVIKKELVRFNTIFKDVYLMETKQILKDEV